jgi:hypothetical protein
MNTESLFRRGWITAGQGELWNCNSTYCTVPYSYLPSMPQATDDLRWLDGVSAELRQLIETTSTLSSANNRIANLAAIIERAKHLRLKLPEPFVQFMRQPELQNKVPTCTACFLELSEDLIALGNLPGRVLLRFMNDSQGCVTWYLCLAPDAEPSVVASYYFFDKDIFDAMEYEDISYEGLASAAFVCADSFTEFLFRFWVENTIWCSLAKKVPMSALQEAYRRQITKKL